jgi:hypothetical protein
VAEDTSPATEVGRFLSRLDSADRQELERASSAVRSDESAWKAAGKRVAQIVARMGLDEQKAQLFQRAAEIVHGKEAQIQHKDPQAAIWAAQGVIVGLLADGSAKRTDLRRTDLGVLFKPFAQWIRETPIRAPGENMFCEKHKGVPLKSGHCQRCDDEERYPPRW